MRPPQHSVLPLHGKLLRLAVTVCLCLLPEGLSAQAVADLSLAAARGGFRPAVARAWELACAGWYDGALAVVSEARRRTSDADEIRKLDAMIVTYTMLKQRADAAANVTPPTTATAAPATLAAPAAPAAPAPRPAPGALRLSISTGPSPAASVAPYGAPPGASGTGSAVTSTPVPADVVARELSGSATPAPAGPPPVPMLGSAPAAAAGPTPASVQVSLSAAPPQVDLGAPAPAATTGRRRRLAWLPWRRSPQDEAQTAPIVASPAPALGAAPARALPDTDSTEPTSSRSLLGRLDWPRTSSREPGNWTFAVGPALRQGGGNVDFTRQELRRPDGGQYVNGHHRDGDNFLIEGDRADAGSATPTSSSVNENVSPQLDPVGWQTVDPNGVPNSGDETYFRNVTFDRSVLTSASAELDGSWALSGEASRSLGRNPFRASRLTLGLDVSHCQANATASNGHGVSTTTLTGILYKEGGAVPANPRPVTPYQEEAGTVTQGGPTNYGMTDELFEMGGARTTDVAVDLDAEAYVAGLSAGLQYDLNLSAWFTLSAGVGPALHLAFARSSLDQEATWDAPASTLDGEKVPDFASSESDSAFALCGGLFLAVGARTQLTKGLALDLSLRYDEVLGAIETEHAEFDLSGLAGQIRLIYTF